MRQSPPAVLVRLGRWTRGRRAGCVAGAADVKTLEDMLRAVGFEQVSVVVKPESREFIQDWLPGSGAEEYVASANITAQKPKSRGCC